MFDFCKARDQTGLPVQFNMRGEDSHKTVIGGVFSFLGSMFILLLTVTVLLGFASEP